MSDGWPPWSVVVVLVAVVTGIGVLIAWERRDREEGEVGRHHWLGEQDMEPDEEPEPDGVDPLIGSTQSDPPKDDPEPKTSREQS